PVGRPRRAACRAQTETWRSSSHETPFPHPRLDHRQGGGSRPASDWTIREVARFLARPMGGETLNASRHRFRVRALILDVDGVLLDSPHEQAWRDALTGLADPSRFTSRIYLEEVAGKPRLQGAVSALKALGVGNAEGEADAYAVRKQAR